MRRVVILGGGFGGVATAVSLRPGLAEADEVILVDRRTHFMMGFRKSWVVTGRGTADEGRRPLAALESRGIRVLNGTVTAIDPAARAVGVDGRRLEADALVVALGAELAPDQVPGFNEHALNFYDPGQLAAVSEALRNFRGGRVLIGIFGLPYKCPPAPFELALLLSEFFKDRGVAATIEVFGPQPMAIPILGPAGCAAVEGRLAARGITFLPNRRAVRVEAGEVVFETERRPFDILIGVPPHRVPAVVRQSGLAADGWVRVNPETLETDFADVYAVGDVNEILMADGRPLPKAGVFAEAEGEVVAARIAARFAGRQPEVTFAGNGHCYLEVGRGEAMVVRGGFLERPTPAVELLGPSPDYLREKYEFERRRLAAWFGG